MNKPCAEGCQTPTPCGDLVPDCTASRLPDVTLTDDETRGALGSVMGRDLSGIISFDEALQRAGEEDGHPEAKTVQVILGSADADRLHWGTGVKLYYAIEWSGVSISVSGPVGSSPRYVEKTWGTVIDAHSGPFIVGGG